MYWKNEQTGQLKWIIMKFLRQQTLSLPEFDALAWYIKQWIDKTYLQVAERRGTNKRYDELMRDLARKCEKIQTDVELQKFVMVDCMNAGIDPF